LQTAVHNGTHSTPEPVELDCGIRLRGSIDLVERHSSGHIRISDHKTGKADGGLPESSGPDFALTRAPSVLYLFSMPSNSVLHLERPE
jgi:hypothetical protein